MSTNGVSIPPDRVRAAQDVARVLKPGRRVALTTHVSADGDGLGSEVGLWYLLRARGLHPAIANPTPPPERFGFLLPEGADASDHAVKEIERADVIMVLDISDLARLGDLARAVRARPGVVHRPPRQPGVAPSRATARRARSHGYRRAGVRLRQRAGVGALA